MKVPRDVNMANVKFIRVGGDAPAGAAPPVTPAAPAAVDQAAGSGSGGVADAAAAAVGAGGANPYPGDDATKAQLAAWMGREAEKRGLPEAAAGHGLARRVRRQEPHFGDADSVGFFQMRVGIWNKGEYAGFPEKPELQVKWFLDQAEAVKKQRIAAGKSVTDPNQFGDWIADVERPAEQYRGRYGLRLGEANGLLGQAGSRRRPPRPPPPRPRPLRARRWPPPPRVPPEPKPGDSGQFMAAARPQVVDAKKGGSGSFLAVQPPAGPAERGRASAASVPGMVDAAAAAAPGSGAEHARRVRAQASPRPSSACTRPASTPARRSTSTSRPPASAPATRGARAS